ncbi:MAG: FHA domain-containing protein, partial [Methylobacterium sp.]
IIGRDPTADFQLPVSTISRHHARIGEADSIYTVEDLGSTHGTSINGRKLEPGSKRVLRHGDIIELTSAKVTCAIETDKVASVEPGEGTQQIAARAVQGILGRIGEASSDGPFLRVIAGAGEGSRFPLSSPHSEWTLGRSRDCEVALGDLNVSRRHAQIKKDWHGYVIYDLGSKNGVQVGDAPIQHKRRLRDRDEITIGPIRLVFVDPDAELLEALKDVPGFEREEDPATMGPAESHLGAPEVPALGFSPGEPGGTLPQPDDGLGDDEDNLSNIDPELLRSAKQRLPVDWLIIGGVSALALGAAVTLVLMLT